ncbi:hypothetical protein [Aliibacillus thermotolerans]|uniref:hypothetical protein n=1 Tax=Aliibacillus thermotolerans TaxID=1834418 RepID=UPI0036721A16
MKYRIKDPCDELPHKIPTEWSHDGELQLVIARLFILLVLESQRNALPAVNLRKYTARNNEHPTKMVPSKC